MRETLQPIAKILEEAGGANPPGWCCASGRRVGVVGRERAFVELLEKSPAGLECALDFVLDTKRHWFGAQARPRHLRPRRRARAEDHRRAAVVRVSLANEGSEAACRPSSERLTEPDGAEHGACVASTVRWCRTHATQGRERRELGSASSGTESAHGLFLSRAPGVQAQFPSRSEI